MEVLRWSRRIHHLDIVISGETKKALQPSAGMFRPAAFKPMRQEQHDSAEPPPFVFRAGDKLIHNHLRGVPKIAELRLPDDQPLRAIQAVAVLKTEHTGL